MDEQCSTLSEDIIVDEENNKRVCQIIYCIDVHLKAWYYCNTRLGGLLFKPFHLSNRQTARWNAVHGEKFTAESLNLKYFKPVLLPGRSKLLSRLPFSLLRQSLLTTSQTPLATDSYDCAIFCLDQSENIFKYKFTWFLKFEKQPTSFAGSLTLSLWWRFPTHSLSGAIGIELSNYRLNWNFGCT